MRRDLDLVRDILIKVGEADTAVNADDLVGDRPYELVAYHCMLLAQHGLIDLGEVEHDMNGDCISLTVNGLTWDGEDYLTAIADPSIWRKVKTEISKVSKSVTFEVVKSTAVLLAERAIRTNLGL